MTCKFLNFLKIAIGQNCKENNEVRFLQRFLSELEVKIQKIRFVNLRRMLKISSKSINVAIKCKLLKLAKGVHEY